MRFEEQPRRLVVSRRNLLTLLAKLDANQRQPGISAVAIMDPDDQIILHAEEDSAHYDPERRAALGHWPGPGPVHPREEEALSHWPS